MRVAIFCADGLEQCECLVVYDLLHRAKIDTDLVRVGEGLEIKSSHGLLFKANKLIDEINFNDYDALVLPGGIPGSDNLAACKPLVEALKDFKAKGKLIAAICAAPYIFVDNGLVSDGKFTCYPGFEHGLNSTHNKVEVDDNVITARGLGANFEFAYEIIKFLSGEELAKKVLDQIQY